MASRTARLRATPPARTGLRSIRWRRHLIGYLFISPWIAGFALFTAFPMIYSLFLSFTKYDLLGPPEFVGFSNFERMVSDHLFLTALGNTAFYTLLAVPIQLLLALFMALLLNQKLRGINVFRTALYLPTVTPTVAFVVLFVYMYNPEFGIFNAILGWFGIPKQGWLTDPNLAKPAFIIMSLWHVGGQMVIFLAGLQAVPETLVEAASIDGAGKFRRFWHVTVPMISPVIFFNLVLGIIGSFQVFATAYIATNGGPKHATLFYVLWMYRHAFENFRMGYAATLGWVLLGVILVFTVVQFAISRRWVYYEGEGA